MPAPLTTTFLVCAVALALLGTAAALGVGICIGLAISMELARFWVVGNAETTKTEEVI